MICYLNGQKIDLPTTRKNCLGSGTEGTVYQYQNTAIKIYHDYVIIGRRELKDNIYKNIETTRIIPPQYSVTDLYYRYIGHSQKLIEKGTVFSKKSIDMPCQNVISNFRLLEDDSVMFAQNFVLMDDVIHNIIDNGTLYFIDTGCYEIANLDSIKENRALARQLCIEEPNTITSSDELEYRLKLKNLATCYDTIWANIERNIKFSNKKLRTLKRKIIDDLDQTNVNNRLSSVLNDYMKKDDTIRTLVKRM